MRFPRLEICWSSVDNDFKLGIVRRFHIRVFALKHFHGTLLDTLLIFLSQLVCIRFSREGKEKQRNVTRAPLPPSTTLDMMMGSEFSKNEWKNE